MNFYSLIEIVDLLETRIISATNDTDLAVIFDDLRTLVRGVGSLDSLRRSVVVDIPLKSVSISYYYIYNSVVYSNFKKQFTL